MEQKIELEGRVFFEYNKQDILSVGDILSEIIFGKKGMFYDLESYLKDEVPFIHTDRFLGLQLGIMQNPDSPSIFCLELTDLSIEIRNLEADQIKIILLEDRLLYYVTQCPEFKILND